MSEVNPKLLTTDYLRLVLRDQTPADNLLLDDHEFDDAEINNAIEQCIDIWNEGPPVFCNHQYDRSTFPWRYYLAIGACSKLMRSAALRFQRNTLQVNVGQAAVDDQNKAGAYMNLFKQLDAEFREWVLHKKIEIQQTECWGSV